MNLQHLFRACICLFLSLILAACNLIVPAQIEKTPLKITYNPWPGFLPLVIAKEKGFFTKQGVNVEIFYVEDTQLQMADLGAGKYDGATLALGSIVIISSKNHDLRIIFASDESAGADAVVASPSIGKIQDLKGKALGTGIGGFGELFAVKMLETANLTSEDVTLVNMDGEQVPARLKKGDIQAGQTWEPYVSQAAKSGARVLFSSDRTPGLIPDVVAFQSSVLRDRPDDIKAFVRAWFQAAEYWKTHPAEGNAIIAKLLNVKADTISLEGIKLFSLSDNVKAFTPGNDTTSLYYTARLYADFFVRSGGVTRPPDIDKLLDPSFLKS
ncbi:MAG: ABC transporter substrate-binding protein [Oscillatoriales cyanobacterium RU_3_3]|nr:ABC transporter substrate-binding protein [Oscillatoriales cyanobacterium RU_3_3]NJR22853.1 ABC transporter substrate-binding protein [Richelia sp. CSU_2_1]